MRDLYRSLGELLGYPDGALRDRAYRCLELAASLRPQAAGLIEEFAMLVQTKPSGALEETYTAAFDLNPDCCPYVGYQLVGEDPRRATFMLELQERYRAAGFDHGKELPDHLAVILRFLGHQADPAMEHTLVEDALLPALQKMIPSLPESHPYRKLLQATAAALTTSGANGGSAKSTMESWEHPRLPIEHIPTGDEASV